VAVNCAALPDNLLESELFGHEKGAFTGATQRKPGRVSLAEGGTLLLDEIGDVSPAVQVKLLRLLQQKEYEPLGATATKTADVRFVAATHQDLEAMVEEGNFREDLYYRLNVVPLFMPPLRDHPEDVPDLARRFCARLASENDRERLTLDDGATEALAAHDWPGNVRELVNLVERLVVFCDSDVITAPDVARELERSPRPRAPSSTDESPPATSVPGAGLAERKNEAERSAIEEALERARGNRTQAARLLGISRRTLYKRMSALSIT
jgi:DNA-binding NtrC family response regulator